MKTETKAELRKRIAILEDLLAEVTKVNDAAERADWEKKIPIANIKAFNYLANAFPNTFYDMTFIHVDGSGYWYTFELTNDKRKQTYCIRHEELEDLQSGRKIQDGGCRPVDCTASHSGSDDDNRAFRRGKRGGNSARNRTLRADRRRTRG